jgi:hypothetical protein
MTTAAKRGDGESIRPARDGGHAARPLPTNGKLFVIALRCGRLANRLALFANFIALAEEEGHRVANVTFHSYAHLFETTRRDIYCRYPIPNSGSLLDAVPGVAGVIRKTRIFYHAVRAASVLNNRFGMFGRATVTLRERLGEGRVWLDNPEVQARIRDAKTVFVYGWTFRAPPGCVQRHAEKIKAFFRPIETHERASRQVVDRLRQRADVVVGVHIRRTDYHGWHDGRFYFPVSRFAGWMRELAEQFPARKVAFLVCSDELRDAREFAELSVGFGTGVPVEDLYALARCDCVFGPPSTFSQWASFYGNNPLLHLHNSDARIERERFRVSDLAEIP